MNFNVPIEFERLTAERDEARAWARRYYQMYRAVYDQDNIDTIAKNLQLMRALVDLEDLRKQFAAAMAEIEARNQAAYFATVDNPPPFSPVMEED